ncbi:hypothetical protein MDS_0929 [Ectopseudomonas mendocina NK-01]|nr:hypothetical protein MDS_0929 [Pseudomonas mendocina NK-01]
MGFELEQSFQHGGSPRRERAEIGLQTAKHIRPNGPENCSILQKPRIIPARFYRVNLWSFRPFHDRPDSFVLCLEELKT